MASQAGGEPCRDGPEDPFSRAAEFGNTGRSPLEGDPEIGAGVTEDFRAQRGPAIRKDRDPLMDHLHRWGGAVEVALDVPPEDPAHLGIEARSIPTAVTDVVDKGQFPTRGVGFPPFAKRAGTRFPAVVIRPQRVLVLAERMPTEEPVRPAGDEFHARRQGLVGELDLSFLVQLVERTDERRAPGCPRRRLRVEIAHCDAAAVQPGLRLLGEVVVAVDAKQLASGEVPQFRMGPEKRPPRRVVPVQQHACLGPLPLGVGKTLEDDAVEATDLDGRPVVGCLRDD